MIVPVMAISNLLLTQQIYSEKINGTHANNRDRVPLKWAKRKYLYFHIFLLLNFSNFEMASVLSFVLILYHSDFQFGVFLSIRNLWKGEKMGFYFYLSFGYVCLTMIIGHNWQIYIPPVLIQRTSATVYDRQACFTANKHS